MSFKNSKQEKHNRRIWRTMKANRVTVADIVEHQKRLEREPAMQYMDKAQNNSVELIAAPSAYAIDMFGLETATLMAAEGLTFNPPEPMPVEAPQLNAELREEQRTDYETDKALYRPEPSVGLGGVRQYDIPKGTMGA